jgi:hypothetical protein
MDGINRWVFLVLLLPAALFARPVSYADSWTLTQKNDSFGHILSLHYSPTVRYSLGLYTQSRPDINKAWYIATCNALIKRWNLPSAQANIFFLSGVGISRNKGKMGGAAQCGLNLDYETRRILVAYENRAVYAERVDKSIHHIGRLGFSPYVAAFDALQPWILLQYEYKDSKTLLTPLLRLYRNNVLVEFGLSTKGTILFNWIVTF